MWTAVMVHAAVEGLDVSVADQLEVVGLVAAAAVLGGILGFERELANKTAGARTHMLVAGGSALAVAVGHVLITTMNETGGGDPARALHAVLTGIGFLGAGAIIRHNDSRIEGLTTAASLWFAAMVGIATGFALIPLAAGSSAIGFVVLRVIHAIERRIAPDGRGN